MNKGTPLKLATLEQIQSPLPFWVARKFQQGEGESGFTTWKELKDWADTEAPNYRQILQTELLWETDYPAPETNKEVFNKAIIPRLKENGIGYQAWFTGSKSVHVHAFFPELKGFYGSCVIEYDLVLIFSKQMLCFVRDHQTIGELIAGQGFTDRNTYPIRYNTGFSQAIDCV